MRAGILALRILSNPGVLSVNTAIKLFYLKIAPIVTYGIELVWKHLLLSDLLLFDRVLATYLKRVLSVSVMTRNRYVFLMAACDTFVERIKRQFSLSHTAAYADYLHLYDEKYALIEPEFFLTRAMTVASWRGPHQGDRHVVTRYAAHGFHHTMCVTQLFHDPVESCICRFCSSRCTKYHFLACTMNPHNLTSVACST